MTRKRFIKLLMANGTPRNKAQKIAKLYNQRKTPYCVAYKEYGITSGIVQGFLRLGSQARKTREAVSRLARAIDALKKGLVTPNEQS